jgi:hypothetical protein
MALNDDLEKTNRLLLERRGIEEEILDEIRDYTNVLQDQAKLLTFQSQEKKDIYSTTRNLNKIAQQNYSILEKELGTSGLLKKLQKDKISLQKEIIGLNELSGKKLGSNARIQSEISNTIKDTIASTQALISEMEQLENTTNDISKNLGVKTFSALSDISKSIPGLRKFSSPFEKASEAARNQVISNSKINAFNKIDLKTGKGLTAENVKALGIANKLKDSNGNLLRGTAALTRIKKEGLLDDVKSLKSMSGMKAGVNSLAKSASKAGPQILATFLLEALKETDKIVGDMAKSLNMSYQDASRLKSELTSAANSSGKLAVTSKEMAISYIAINKTLGLSAKLNKENLVTFSNFRKVAGFTNEELMGVQSLVNATNGSYEDITGEFLAQARLTGIKNKAALNEKDLMKDISKISAATTLSLSKNPSLLAEAVATAKSLGLEMSQLEGIADGLLKFESSISSELEAELLIGRALNLEKAREYALNNNIAGVAREISQQMGNALEFGEMNRIKQGALAKAMGMGREELARTLFLNEQIGNVSKETYAIREKQVKELEAKGLTQDQIKNQLAKTSIEDLEKQADMQERLVMLVEKLKEVFVGLVEPLLPILDVFVDIFSLVGKIVKLLDPILSFIPVITYGIEDLFSAAINPWGKNNWGKMSKAIDKNNDSIETNWSMPRSLRTKWESLFIDDGVINPEGGLVVSGKKGTYRLNQNDTIVAGTELGKTSNQQITNPGGNETLLKEFREMKNILTQILNKEGSVYIDGSKVGKTLQLASSRMG